jgi:hypothetical protein
VLDDTGRTVARIYRHGGVEVRWQTVDAARVDAAQRAQSLAAFAGPAIYVMLLPESMEKPYHVREAILGMALSESHTTLLFCARAQRAAQTDQRDLGAIMGHVIAHEIGHLLLRTGHTATGLMRADLDVQLACRGMLWFDRRQAALIRESLEGSRF